MTANYKSFVDDYKNHFDHNYKALVSNYKTDYMQTSVNIQNLMPNVAIEKHEEIFKNMLFEQLMAQADVSLPNISEHIIIEGFTSALYAAKEKPAIFCTYHLGSYRLIASLLARLEIDFMLIMSEEGLKEMSEEFYTLNESVKKHYNINTSLEIISAEKPTAVLSMLRALKSNKSLLVYIDGNIGAGESPDSLIDVPFLNSTIACRKGISMLSFISKCAIIPVLAERRNLYENRIKFLKPICPNPNSIKELYTKNSTKKLFNILAVYVKQNLSNWEGWLYVHRFMNEESKRTFDYHFNSSIKDDRFKLIYWQNDYLLFDPITFFTYSVNSKK
jgi:lauroyl/myristoyl acyltransferase